MTACQVQFLVERSRVKCRGSRVIYRVSGVNVEGFLNA